MEVSVKKSTDGNVDKRSLWKETIEVWDYLSENKYEPSDFSYGEVKMNHQGFMKLVKQTANCVSIKETRHYRINALWIGNVELSYTEIKMNKDKWIVDCDWKPVSEIVLF